MTTRVDVVKRVQEAPLPPGQSLPIGAEGAVIDAFKRHHELKLPGEVVEWLTLYNGLQIGPGGLYGIQTEHPELDIRPLLVAFPEWLDHGWIPIAGDGNGDYYVLDTTTRLRHMHPIYFVDHEEGYDRPSYIVASNLWSFLDFLLAKDGRTDPDAAHWPFDSAYVLSRDPALAQYIGTTPFPWNS